MVVLKENAPSFDAWERQTMKVLSHSFKLRPASKLTFDQWASHPYLAGIGPTSVVCDLMLADKLLEAFRFRKKRSTWCWPKGNQVKLALLRSLRLQRTKVNGKSSANNQRSRCTRTSFNGETQVQEKFKSTGGEFF